MELHTHQALTITEAYIDDINRRFELKKRELDHWSEKYILSIPRPAGIPIISKGGTRRIYFKVDINCKEGLMHEYGISGSFIAQGMDPVEIREKLFQYSCKVDEFKQIFDYNPDEASLYAQKRLTSEYSLASAQVFTNSFRMIHDLVKYCHSSYLEKEELKKRLQLLYSNYEKVPDIAGERILPLINNGIRELDVLVDRGKLAPRFMRLCDELVELLHMEVMVSEPQAMEDETVTVSGYQAVREEEEQKQQEEERLRLEKEEQERIAREGAERKQREDEERRRREEEERLQNEKEKEEREKQRIAQEEAERKKREEDERKQREEEEKLQREKEERQRIAREGAERKKRGEEILRKQKEDEEKSKKQREEQERRRREEDEKLRRQREEEKDRKKIESLQREKVERARKEREERQRKEAAKRKQNAKEDSEKIAVDPSLERGSNAAKRAFQLPAGQREIKRTGAGKSSPTKIYALALVLGALLVGYLLLSPGSDNISGTDDITPIATSSSTPEMAATVTSTATETPAAVIASPAYDKTTTNSIGMEFVLIPAGEFEMGSFSSEEDRRDGEGPVHSVKIDKAYYLGKYEVTQKQWREVMGSNPSSFKGDDLPVEKVSWNDAQEFVKKLNEKEGTDKYRLPSEAEWEYAARAGTTTRYSFGNDESDLGEYAWYCDNSNSKTHPVGQKQPNPWGLYDMHGNVWEWVQDKWYSNYDGAPTDGSAWESGDGAFRVVRGGSWIADARFCRSAVRRGFFDPGFRYRILGFRLLQEV